MTLIHTGPEPEVVEQIVQEIFQGLIGEDGPLPYPLPYDGSPLDVSASVSVTGEWSGHVVMACGEVLGRKIAAGLLMTEPEEITDDDLSDAMGEFANVVGGNVKAMMPGPSKLSLPVAVLGSARERLPGTVEATRVEMTWHDAPFIVSVWAPEEKESNHKEMAE
ncbi:MAG TPA: chemotaxis protein CheX [Acidimicrobiales bacterium]|nr:chemotaxis protein CheX [Acidimicrobiales bacterium]